MLSTFMRSDNDFFIQILTCMRWESWIQGMDRFTWLDKIITWFEDERLHILHIGRWCSILPTLPWTWSKQGVEQSTNDHRFPQHWFCLSYLHIHVINSLLDCWNNCFNSINVSVQLLNLTRPFNDCGEMFLYTDGAILTDGFKNTAKFF